MAHIKIDAGKSRDLIACVSLVAVAGLLIALIYKAGYLYGSETDWVSQHSVIPAYFRQLFYATGKLFPNYAMALGAGQNIYYLSYYGFLNPVILFSYCLPMVSMVTYLTVTSILGVIVTVCLCYVWLRKCGFSSTVAWLAALCLLFAGPLIFHSHRQLTFVNYFPFLFLGLLAIERYFCTHRQSLFILSVFGAVMTSYFFSVGVLLVFAIVAVYRYGEVRRPLHLQRAGRELLPLAGGVATGIAMAAVLWLPTLYVILHSRGGKAAVHGIWSYLMPNLGYAAEALLYGTYTLGLSLLTLIALVAVVFRGEQRERRLAIILWLLLLFPICAYVLNGTLYARPKALIPFLPLYIMVTAIFLRNFAKFLARKTKPCWRRAALAAVLLLFLIPSAWICWYDNHGNTSFSTEEYLTDAGTSEKGLSLSRLLDKSGDQLVPASTYEDVHNPAKLALIREVLKADPSFYRINDLADSNITCNQVYEQGYRQTSLYSSTYNQIYNRFYYDIMGNAIATRNRAECCSTQNILFQSFMDVKYLITEKDTEIPGGYRVVNKRGDYTLSENDHTMPLAYASGNIMAQREYAELTFPFNLPALFGNIVVARAEVSSEASAKEPFQITKLDLSTVAPPQQYRSNVTVNGKDGHYLIVAKEGAALTVPIPVNLKDQVLILGFAVSNRKNAANLDTAITINGVKNKLSKKTAPYPNSNHHFVYILSSAQSCSSLTVEFSPGTYEVSRIEAYTLPLAEVAKAAAKVDPFRVDSVNDNTIAGTVDVTHDGYFATTLPYDQGYAIRVDGRTQSYTKVNTAFVGFPITKGVHHVVITYQAPWRRVGLALSAVGSGLFLLILGRECLAGRRKRKGSFR